MIKLKCAKKIITAFILSIFFLSNVGSGAHCMEIISQDKLAAGTFMSGIRAAAVEEYVSRAILKALLANADAAQRALQDVTAPAFSYGVLHSEKDPRNRALYRFYYDKATGRMIAHRYSRPGESPDPLYSNILSSHVRQTTTNMFGAETFVHELIDVPKYLQRYILTLNLPHLHRGGIAKSLALNNGPVTAEEKRVVEELLARRQLIDIEEGCLYDTAMQLIKDYYQDLAGKVKFRYTTEPMKTKVGEKIRVFPVYSRKIEGSDQWEIYFHEDFIKQLEECQADVIVRSLIDHEFYQLSATESTPQALAEREMAYGMVNISGMSISILDAYIYYFYSDELMVTNQEWGEELYEYVSSWITWNLLGSIFKDDACDKAEVLRDREMEDYINSFLAPGYAELKELKIPAVDKGRDQEIDLWEYTLRVCASLQHFEKGELQHFAEFTYASNFRRFYEMVKDVFADPKLSELLWLVVMFHQIGKAMDPNYGNYYSVGRNAVEIYFTDYYEKMGHIADGRERNRLIKLGSELAYRFGDMRGVLMGERTLDVLLKIKDVEGLNAEDKDTLLKLINIFTVIYARNKASVVSLDDVLISGIVERTAEEGAISVDALAAHAEEPDEDFYKKRLSIWCGSEAAKEKVRAAMHDALPERENREELKEFLRKVNFYNASPVVREIVKKMNSARGKRKKYYADILIRMFYFFKELNVRADDKEWIVFAQNTVAEDMINIFGHISIAQIDQVLNKKNKDIISAFREDNKRIVLLGIPFLVDGNRLVADLYREGKGPKHGINKASRLLRKAVEKPEKTLAGRYYDLVVLVVDESSAAEKVLLIKDAKKKGRIPKNARVVIVSQPSGMITGNWSAIINLMCNEKLKINEDVAGDVQLVGIDKRRLKKNTTKDIWEQIKDCVVDGEQHLGGYIEDKNVAVVLSAGTGKRNYPLTASGYGCKGGVTCHNGEPYLHQTFGQIMCNFDPERTGMLITTNDGIKCPSRDVAIGEQGFQIIGAAKPAMIGPGNDRYNSAELGELGCMLVDLVGGIGRFVEKPNEDTWQTRLDAIDFVPTNWADYYLRPDFLAALVRAYGELKDKEGTPLYLKYGLDTSKDFSEPCTISKCHKFLEIKRKEFEKKGKLDFWEREAKRDYEEIWVTAQQLKESFGIGFVDAGRYAYFMDTGTNLTFKALAEELLENPDLRELMGMTAGNGYTIDPDNNLIGPNVRISSNVQLGKNNVIVGDVTIAAGRIGNNCLIVDSLINEIYITDDTMVYGVYRPEAGEQMILDHSHTIATEVFLQPGKIAPRRRRRKLGVTLVEFPDGHEAVKVPVLQSLDSKANDDMRMYKVRVNRTVKEIFVRNGEIVGGNMRDWIKTKGVKYDEETKELFYIKKTPGKKGIREQRIVLGEVVGQDGGSVWDFNIWPRDARVYGHPRLGERGTAGGKLSFAEISSFTDKTAITSFKSILADSPAVLPIRNLKYNRALAEKDQAARGFIITDPARLREVFWDEVSFGRLMPRMGHTTTFLSTQETIKVTLGITLGDIHPDQVRVRLHYGQRGEDWDDKLMKHWEALPDGRYLYKLDLPIPEYCSEGGDFELTCKVELVDGAESDFKWIGADDNNAKVVIVSSALDASLLMRRIKRGRINIPLWQADFTEAGVITANDKKPAEVDLEKYERVRKRLVDKYGAGIFGAAAGIKVVENLQVEGSAETAPVAKMSKGYIIVDVDVFGMSDDELFLVLDHDLKHSIIELLEDNEAIRELAVIYMSLQLAIEDEINGPEDMSALAANERFWHLLIKLRQEELSGEQRDSLMLSAAIDYMKDIPYYERLFTELGFDRERWRQAVAMAEGKVTVAINVYHQLPRCPDKEEDILPRVQRVARDVIKRIGTLNDALRQDELTELSAPIEQAV